MFFSLDPTTVLVGGVVLLCVWWWMSTRRPPGLPPGPGPALPLLGHLHLLAKDPRPQFWRWRRQYGDVFSLYLGGRLVVVLASYSAIREALVTFADVFSDRPDDFFLNIFKKKGIIVSSGTTWKQERKTALEILRAMGMGKNVLAERIQDEITHYVHAIKDHQGAPVDLSRLTQVSVSNNICSVLFGKRYDYQDPEFIRYLQSFSTLAELLSGTGIVNALPFLRYIPGDPARAKEPAAIMDQLLAFVDKQIAERQKPMGTSEEKTTDDMDFINSYLLQIQKYKALGKVDGALDEENLRVSLVSLFVAGSETTSTAIRWTLLFFLHHPHVQDKCFQEISDVIGPDRLPCMQDRPNLTYLEATICEMLRKADILPLAVLHATACDVTFRGYVIPKGTSIMPAQSFSLKDPEIWGDPENFRPERFISPDGKLIKAEQLTPFSTGRRVCLGESLARMELFLYLATLIQHFRFLLPEEEELPPLQGVIGVTHFPTLYKIRAVPRI